MKKITLAILLSAGMIGGEALADNHTYSLGFARSKVEGFKNIRGVNLQYRYEMDSPLGVLASFSWLKRDENATTYLSQDIVTSKIDVHYFSLLVGPAYRLNDYFSIYALGGFSRIKTGGHDIWVNNGNNYSESGNVDGKSTQFAWGTGIIVNPIANLSFTLGYEGSRARLDDNYSINGFNVGLGYRF